MPNHFFSFKSFTVQQEHCSMKVCTDACLFGALVAASGIAADRCLDIGTGTGLLSLMFAQKNPVAQIDTVEIETAAAAQAAQNFAASPWKDNLHLHNSSILDFQPDKKYDLIFSNPPFFENDLTSSDEKKNHAKHDTGLTLQQLITTTKALLNNNGTLAVLLPFHRTDEFIKLAAASNLFCQRKILVRQSTTHGYFRSILFFKEAAKEMISEEILIRDGAGNYSERFVELLKEYYLYL